MFDRMFATFYRLMLMLMIIIILLIGQYDDDNFIMIITFLTTFSASSSTLSSSLSTLLKSIRFFFNFAENKIQYFFNWTCACACVLGNKKKKVKLAGVQSVQW